jgi:CSLREA domain-containing protein
MKRSALLLSQKMKLHISNSGDIGKRCRWFLIFFLSLVVLQFIAMPGTVLAANIVVNSTVDLQPPVPGDGCTLREAIYNANTTSDTTGGDCATGTGDDTITFDFSVPGTIDLGTYGGLSINDSAGGLTTIDGESLGRVVITGGTNSQVFAVGGVVTLRNLIIQDGGPEMAEAFLATAHYN